MTTRTKGHASTHAFLDNARALCDTHCPGIRSQARPLLQALAKLSGDAQLRLVDLHAAEEDEKDPSVRGKLPAAADKQKTIVRLAGSVQQSLMELISHLGDVETHLGDVEAMTVEKPSGGK